MDDPKFKEFKVQALDSYLCIEMATLYQHCNMYNFDKKQCIPLIDGYLKQINKYMKYEYIAKQFKGYQQELKDMISQLNNK